MTATTCNIYSPVTVLEYSLFPETRALSEIKEYAVKLKENNYAKAQELSKKIEKAFKKYVEDTNHNFKATLTVNRIKSRPGIEQLNANDVVMENGNKYLLFACPKDVKEAQVLLEAALQQNISLFVSLLESTDAKHKFNNYWKEENISQIKTDDGWSFHVKETKVIDQSTEEDHGTKNPQLIETTIEAKNSSGETRLLTHLHYDGWRDQTPIPSERVFQSLLDRIEELQRGKSTPFAINCHGGKNRTGTCAVSHYLRSEVDNLLRMRGSTFDKTRINIPLIIINFKKQRYGFLKQASQLANVYSILGDYIEKKRRHEIQANFQEKVQQ